MVCYVGCRHPWLCHVEYASYPSENKSEGIYGARAWWLDYQYFPELQKIGLSDDTIPDLRQRLSFYLSGGYAGMTASSGMLILNENLVGFGGCYSYFFSKIFGFRSGLDFSYARSSSSMGGISDYYYKEDEEHDLILRLLLEKLNETYNYYMPSVPVEVWFSLANSISEQVSNSDSRLWPAIRRRLKA